MPIVNYDVDFDLNIFPKGKSSKKKKKKKSKGKKNGSRKKG